MHSVLEAAREGLVIVPDPARQTLKALGPDSVEWLNGLVTCDVKSVTATRGVFGLLLTKQGKISADLDIIQCDGGLLLGVGAGLAQSVLATLERYQVMEDVELSAEPGLCWLRVHGPGAAAARGNAEAAFGQIDWLGVGGAALAVTNERADALISALVRSSPQARVLRKDEWDLLRAAHGFPEFGVDYGADDNPHEAALDRRAISWTKGCYLGQEVVCMQDMRGKVKRRLALLETELADAPPKVSSEVRAAGESEPVGHVTTSAVSAGSALLLARLRAPFYDGNRELSVEGRRARIVAPAARG